MRRMRRKSACRELGKGLLDREEASAPGEGRGLRGRTDQKLGLGLGAGEWGVGVR